MIGPIIRHTPQGGAQSGGYAGSASFMNFLRGYLPAQPVVTATSLHLRVRADAIGPSFLADALTADYRVDAIGPMYLANSWEGD